MKLHFDITAERKSGRFTYSWRVYDEDEYLGKTGGLSVTSLARAIALGSEEMEKIISFVEKIISEE